MADYDDFSACYDKFMKEVDYSSFSNKLISIFEKYDRRPALMLDLACGTGEFSFEFAKKGIEVIGVDRSEGMLSTAIKKQPEGINNPLFLNQSAEELNLFGTVDGAICMLDSLNHITETNTLAEVFKRVSLFLEKDRLFIFDLNTEYKHSKILGNNTFIKETSGAFCVWQNQCDDGKNVDIFLDMFVEDKDGRYKRFSEDFSERAYSYGEIIEILELTEFELLDILDCETGDIPKDDSQRVLYIVRKK